MKVDRADQSPEAICAPILFISFDGMLQPLGNSQVLTYLYPLSDQGFKFALVSLEQQQDISASAISRLTRQLHAHGIEWSWDIFRQGGINNAARNLWTTFRMARNRCRRDTIGLIHARSYPAALVARLLEITNGIPYLFDMRGYWIDERVAERLWFTNKIFYALGKKVERHLVRHAKGVITLTELQAQDLKKLLPSQHIVV